MSECKVLGKDKIIFATKEDHSVPSSIELVSNEPPSPGLILDNGDINWNCPCLGGMATGPCGVEFREAFSCFHYSEAQPKGSDCFDSFSKMQTCFAKYPEVYKQNDNEDAFAESETGENDTPKETSTKSDANSSSEPLKQDNKKVEKVNN